MSFQFNYFPSWNEINKTVTEIMSLQFFSPLRRQGEREYKGREGFIETKNQAWLRPNRDEDLVSFWCSRNCQCTTFTSSNSDVCHCARGFGRNLAVINQTNLSHEVVRADSPTSRTRGTVVCQHLWQFEASHRAQRVWSWNKDGLHTYHVVSIHSLMTRDRF